MDKYSSWEHMWFQLYYAISKWASMKISAVWLYRNVMAIIKVILNISCELMVKNIYPQYMSISEFPFGGIIKCLTFYINFYLST